MMRAMWSAASGMVAQQKIIDVISIVALLKYPIDSL